MVKQEQKDIETIINESWNTGLNSWNNPYIPRIIVVNSDEDCQKLGRIGNLLKGQLAFMK